MLSALCVFVAVPLLIYVVCEHFGQPQRRPKETPARLVKKGQGR